MRISSGDTPAAALDIGAETVRRLLSAQFPRWAELPVEPVPSDGTDNTLYRLGADMAVRLPCHPRAVGQVDKEHRWLPRLAPLLPLAIPVPLGRGVPGEGYPWPWSVYRWLEGEPATVGHVRDARQAAAALGGFVAALQRIDPAGGPPGGLQNGFRGLPLAVRDAETRASLAALEGTLDTDAARAAWETDIRTPVWGGPPVWLHGDIHAANLLVTHGRISAVIDFGLLGVGDPASDLTVAWTFLTAETREVFRTALSVDEATWARGRGWALAWGLIAHAFYRNTDNALAGISRRAIDEVLADHARGA